MKLYDVDRRIAELLDQLEFDPETGEIGDNTEAVMDELDSLQMEKDRILKYLAKVIINTRANEAALKAEEERLAARRSILAKKEERIMHILDRECGGEKTDLGIAVLSYRHSEKLDVTDADAAIQWLKDNGRTDGIRLKAPEVNKDYVKKLIKAGATVPGAEVVPNVTCQLK